MRRVIPVAFRTPRALRALNVAAVGSAIAAMTSAVFLHAESTSLFHSWIWAVTAGAPSLVVGVVWAMLLRVRATVGTRGVPVGWVLSVPLAALNGALACGLALSFDSGASAFLPGVVLGATFGALAWVPGLLAVLTLFGLPIAWAQRLARAGLAGEERGEIVVGFACVVLGALSFVIAPSPWASLRDAPSVIGEAMLFCAYATVAVACGAIATFAALRREALRRRFIARVEREEVPGLRVEERVLAKMLVRVAPEIETYRIARAEDEELVELDSDGRAVRALQAER